MYLPASARVTWEFEAAPVLKLIISGGVCARWHRDAATTHQRGRDQELERPTPILPVPSPCLLSIEQQHHTINNYRTCPGPAAPHPTATCLAAIGRRVRSSAVVVLRT
jgi:hypothetical protein